MNTTFGSMDGVELFFLICAFLGGFFVLGLFALEFFGIGSGNGHVHTGGDGHFHVGDSDVSFKILSLHSITAFLMMFGLTGFALYRQDTINLIMALIGAVAAGLGSVWFMSKVLSFALSLQSSGTLTMDDAIGGEGEVYLTIPPAGIGRVLVTCKNRLREFDATSDNQEGIRTGERIRVVNVKNNVLLVERITPQELAKP
jgi:membrane-bound ClpP family serine protease